MKYMECGGKRSATPLWSQRAGLNQQKRRRASLPGALQMAVNPESALVYLRYCAISDTRVTSPVVSETAVILIVEDREDDILVIRKAFDKASLPNPVKIVRDGEEALAYLSGEGKYSSRDEYPLPALILLDLKLPRMDGFEVLTWIRKQDG